MEVDQIANFTDLEKAQDEDKEKALRKEAYIMSQMALKLKSLKTLLRTLEVLNDWIFSISKRNL
jgi:hypothetical protein